MNFHNNETIDCKVVNRIESVAGYVPISGAKNAALLLLPAVVLATEPVVLNHIPDIKDVRYMCDILELIGVQVKWVGDNALYLDPSQVKLTSLNIELCSRIRASIVLLGVMLGRFGSVELRLPGGCNLGPRPIDLHIKALTQLGAEFEEHGHYVDAIFKTKGREVSFAKSTVTGTANALLAAVSLSGESVIRDAALEPEIDDLIAFLTTLGAKIKRSGSLIVVQGGHPLKGGKHDVMADRIEAGTFLIAGAIIGGRITVGRINPKTLDALLVALQKVGATIECQDHQITLEMNTRPKALDVVACEYPGFPTDLQPQWCVLSVISEGRSIIQDTVFPERFDHMEELQRMGASFIQHPGRVEIQGVDKLMGAELYARNLRSAAALILSGFVSYGKTSIIKASHLNRGYPGFFQKIKNIQK